MQLPFLKESKYPRFAKDALKDKLINGSEDDHLEFHCVQELMDSVEHKDVKSFRAALEALVLNMFDHGDKDES